MANHKSAEKATRQQEKRRLLNGSRLSRVKTFIKKALAAIQSSDNPAGAVRIAQAEIARAAAKGALKANTASRKIAQLFRRLALVSTNREISQ